MKIAITPKEIGYVIEVGWYGVAYTWKQPISLFSVSFAPRKVNFV